MERNRLNSAVFSGRNHIEKLYQTKLILKFSLLAVLGMAIFCISLYFSMYRETDAGYAQALGHMRFVRGAIAHTFLLTGGGVILILGVAVTVIMVFMSHRIAGPMWRIEQAAKAVGSGDLAQNIHLRTNDEMRPLADKMNDMIAGLRSFVEDLSALHGPLDDEIALLKERTAQGDMPPEELRAVAGAILEKSRDLLVRLENIKTE